MKEKIFVIGHKNPDTDSVAAALVFSDYLKKEGIEAFPVCAGEPNKEAKFVFKFFKEKMPPILPSAGSGKFFLVDHGDLGQAVSGLKNSKVVGVLDHHRISGLSTDEPIFYRAEPLGSTCTIVFKMFCEKGRKVTKKQASLLLAGIISDTLGFASPTFTEEDKKIAQKLVGITGIKTRDFIQRMFEAKSDISGIKTEDLISKDYKDFNLGGKKVGIGVHETTTPSLLKERREEILAELKKIKEKKKLDFIFWGVIDILKKGCFLYLISPDERKLAEKAFGAKCKEENVMFLKGIVSRKKQIGPSLSKIL